jgi:hypothetical protein
MKKLMQLDLFNLITDSGLSINQYYLLCCIRDNVTPAKLNTTLDLRALHAEGWITEGNLSTKSIALIDSIEKLYLKAKPRNNAQMLGDDYKQKLQQYMEMFPDIILPSKKRARVSPVNLEKAFKWFFDNYDYSWDLVFKATKYYVEKQFRENYKYCRTSQFFVRKDNNSDLADLCEAIKTKAPMQSINVKHATRVV